MTRNSKQPIAPTVEEIRVLNDALTARHGRSLRAGEGIALDAVRTAEHTLMTVVLSAADNTLRLELQAAILPDDDHPSVPGDELMTAADFLDAMLDEYFVNERLTRFHHDWRVYEFDGSLVRFRGEETNPSVEALADAWLEQTGNPDDDLQ